MQSSEIDGLQRESPRAMNSDDQDNGEEEENSSWNYGKDNAHYAKNDESNSDQYTHKEREINQSHIPVMCLQRIEKIM